MVGSMPLARIDAKTLREVAHFGLCHILAVMFPGTGHLGFWRAARVDHVAVAVGGVGIDVSRDQYAAIE